MLWNIYDNDMRWEILFEIYFRVVFKIFELFCLFWNLISTLNLFTKIFCSQHFLKLDIEMSTFSNNFFSIHNQGALYSSEKNYSNFLSL